MLLAIHGLLQPRQRMAVMRISNLFQILYNRVWNPLEFKTLQADMSGSMALLDIYFSPSICDVMMHLLYHLMDEL